ncbi:hypothetical protein HBI88_100790 [Parastagonospora nodorum]|nr:hypothetical protein HBH61_138360 [Parastagonospora nodorum]KAH5074522.1 hypothetical protein HBH95_144270 [Parastagonospora nodorum]KAH5788526.1 hypothetical protein HBI97_074750 [Parastagonospora nodorum]KAH5814359.1 hypothetical protein HBI96_072090 [Parastagonospora nodorum]KAH5828494.1 hypothetical protein HBI94_056510 [Parastagonospora nodorum]
MAAAIVIDVPGVIHLQAAPDFEFACLPSQRKKVTPAMQGSGIPTTPTATVSTRATATKLARILHAQYGVVPQGFENLLAGGLTVVNGVETISREAQSFKKKEVSEIMSLEHTEKYGPKSFFRRYVRGMVCTLNSKTLVTNWTLEARKYQIPADGETAEETGIRLAKSEAYTHAVNVLQTRWRETYSDAYLQAMKEEDSAKGQDKMKWQCRRRFYYSMKDSIPQPEISAMDAQQLITRDQVTAAMQTPLFFLPKAQRICIWAREFTADVFARFFVMSREIVDVRRLREQIPGNPHRKLWSNLWPQLCDLFHRSLIGQEDSIRNCSVFARDARIRFNTTFVDPNRQTRTYARARSLHLDLRLDRSEFSSWDQVPILEASLQGFKRSIDDATAGPARANEDEVRDMEDIMPE